MSEEKPEIYVSVDVETDGPVPGPHSMLSVGCAAYLADKTLISTFSANLETLPGATGHPRTMAFWQTEPVAWAAHRKDTVPPEKAMKELAAWVRALPGTPIFVAFPVTFDFLFVQWYLYKFGGGLPFAHSGLDIRTMAMTMNKSSWSRSTKEHLPQHWYDPLPHTHVALDDAIEQGAMFCNMLAELRSQKA